MVRKVGGPRDLVSNQQYELENASLIPGRPCADAVLPNDYLKQHWVHWHNIANGMSDNSSHDSNDEADSDTD